MTSENSSCYFQENLLFLPCKREGCLSFRKIFITLTLFGALGFVALSTLKKYSKKEEETPSEGSLASEEHKNISPLPKREVAEISLKKPSIVRDETVRKERISRFFSKGHDRLPIVETIVYTSRVSWLSGRPAWIADYASHYATSRHFIARSLNERKDYFTQNITPGDTFNVFVPGKKLEFYLLVDLSSCTMDFYYLDLEKDERVFIKSYVVGVGREDSHSPSGSLTPLGKYVLGGKVGIYKPGVEHYFQNQKVEMIEVFGTRWLPFEEALENCTDRAKGYGIHGVPCHWDKEQAAVVEEVGGVGIYNSDGCIRVSKDDIEELFAIIITKRTVVEIVKDKSEVTLPMGSENLMDDL